MNPFPRHAWLAVLLSTSAASAELPLCDPDTPMPAQQRIFETDVAADVRSAAFAEVAAAAEGAEGSADQRYYAGTLYRLGRDHPVALVDRDLARARRLLSNAAMGGQFYAMLGMAEIEMDAGEPMKAMVWAQAFAHFTGKDGSLHDEQYVADLLVRIYDELGRGKAVAQEIDEYVNGFVQAAAPKIEAARAVVVEPTCRREHDSPPMEVLPHGGVRWIARSRAQRTMADPGLALYFVRVDPAGTVIDADVIDSLPDERAGAALMGTAMRIRFNAVDAAVGTRTAIVPVAYNDNSVQFRD